MTITPKKRKVQEIKSSEFGIELEPGKIAIPLLIISQEMTITPENSFSEESESSDPNVCVSPENLPEKTNQNQTEAPTNSFEKREKSKPVVVNKFPKMRSLESCIEQGSSGILFPEVMISTQATETSTNQNPQRSLSSTERKNLIQKVPEVTVSTEIRQNGKPDGSISLEMSSLKLQPIQHIFAEVVISPNPEVRLAPEEGKNSIQKASISTEGRKNPSVSRFSNSYTHLFPEVTISTEANKSPKPEVSISTEVSVNPKSEVSNSKSAKRTMSTSRRIGETSRPVVSVSGIELDEIKTSSTEIISAKKERSNLMPKESKKALNSHKSSLTSDIKLKTSAGVSFASLTTKNPKPKARIPLEKMKVPKQNLVVSGVELDEISSESITLSVEPIPDLRNNLEMIALSSPKTNALSNPVTKVKNNQMPQDPSIPIPTENRRTQQEATSDKSEPHKIGKLRTFYK